MKKKITAFDLYFIIREMQCLIGGKLEKVYHSKSFKNDILFRFYAKDHGKVFLKANVLSNIYITKHKADYDSVSGFGMFLRRHLTNARIREIKQHGFDRIINIKFSVKKKGELTTHNLIIELFGGGNIILIDKDKKILGVLNSQKWKDRTIHPGKNYKFPDPKFDTIDADKKEFLKKIEQSGKSSIVKALASDTALGGEYAEELCARAKLNKNSKIKDLSDEELELLFTIINNMKEEKIEGYVYEETVTPFEFKTAGKLKNKYETFSQALDNVLTEKRQISKKSKAEKKLESKLSKTKSILQKQKQMYKNIKKGAKENQEKAEKIYENYQYISDLLKELKELREEKSWKEIKELFKKKHPSVKIKENENEITVDLK